ncbi:MAG: acyloxyacyl hydrolase [Alphaproteobacteria bacterium]|nr:acyloxyacyl hydrolase [Alphaproteobacteria bacterium]
MPKARARHWIIIGLLLVLGISVGREAAGQVTFGSPGDPARIAIGGGAYDVIPETHPGSGVIGSVLSEYRFGDKLWIISPFLGAMGTGKGDVYAYVGFGFDVHVPYNLILTPSFGGGYYQHGHGVDLGYWWEFRSGAELAYRFADQKRLGVGFYHISNAGLGNRNPGVELVNVVLMTPF